MKYFTYVCIINLNLIIVVLTVEFASGQFTGSESSGFIEVVVRITGGSSSTPITVTVTPSVQSPVSAMGTLAYQQLCSAITYVIKYRIRR